MYALISAGLVADVHQGLDASNKSCEDLNYDGQSLGTRQLVAINRDELCHSFSSTFKQPTVAS